MGVLSFDNIFGEDEIENLFTDTGEEPAEEPAGKPEGQDGSPDGEGKDGNTETKETTEVSPEDLFEDKEEPESVGSEKEEDKDRGGSTTENGGDTSPNENFYSSIANAMAVDGIFPNLDEETIKKVDSAEGLSDAIEAEITARLDDKQKRVLKALENGVEPDTIRRYEGALDYLSKITDQQVSDESEKGEKLRYNLIYQDFVNRGMSPEKADKYTRRSIDAGTDVEDAKEALQSNREFFQKQYDKLQEDAAKEADAERTEQKKRSEKLKDSILKDKALLGDVEISSDVRKKVFDNIMKPVYKDPETGDYLTSLQKYEKEHGAEFLKYAGLFYTLTNEFKDFDSLFKGKVKKEIKKGLSELEKALNGTRRNSDGSLKMITSAREDPESFIGKGFRLDI